MYQTKNLNKMKNTLIEQGKNLMERGYYNKGAYKIAEALNLKMSVKYHNFGYHFEGDKYKRHIFKVRLKKDGKQYTFKFGQSVVEGNNEPTLYYVLACLQKYDVGSFEDFCSEFVFDEHEDHSIKIYNYVVKEFENMERLFSDEELETLSEIQ